MRENIVKAGVVGRLVANDFTGAIVSGKLQEFHPNTGERLDYIEVARALERIRSQTKARAGVDAHIDVHVIGFAKLVGDIAAGATRVMAFFGIAFLITGLFMYAYTRSIRLTAPPLVCSLAAVVWQLGGVTALGFGVDPMSILNPLPGVRHRGQPRGADGRRDARGRRPGARAASMPRRRASAVCCCRARWRSPRDSVGFIAISFIEVRVIQEIAVTASLGVAAIILTNLALLPVLLSYLEIDDKQRRAARAQDDFLRPLWSWVARAGAPASRRRGDRRGGRPAARGRGALRPRTSGWATSIAACRNCARSPYTTAIPPRSPGASRSAWTS